MGVGQAWRGKVNRGTIRFCCVVWQYGFVREGGLWGERDLVSDLALAVLFVRRSCALRDLTQ